MKLYQIDTVNLKVATMNVCGLSSKINSVSNIFLEQDLDIIVITETHLSGKKNPKINDNYNCYYRHRSDKMCKGGVCIAVKKDLCKNAVILESNKHSEWLSVQLNYFSPPIVVTGMYGGQDRKSTRLNSSHSQQSRMPSSA